MPDSSMQILKDAEQIADDKIDQIFNENPVYQRLVVAMKGQMHKGVVKYGQPVRPDLLSLLEWSRHALEETLDKATYLQNMIMLLEEELQQ
ncbi:hypothetical protein ABH14_09945 [Brevibacillus brevis]|uniref:hypothetical protein n=1 Tax=Brevibacillus brevis TaxID=1393 RepID=UPI001900D4DC|nr:hypothetical protein [Brevibacillus brevis]MBH0330112.1 hypothetical protein [Brevibacillus brevis]